MSIVKEEVNTTVLLTASKRTAALHCLVPPRCSLQPHCPEYDESIGQLILGGRTQRQQSHHRQYYSIPNSIW
ncbi:hypothetical protein TNCV_735651 [Trichonephila clavipes]|uniref:Uncharacterized protein n=1 Tax=Trichonephila clavipes TaxID=2585209 RepID=A0A8X6SY89_TRICX|nr:hypothetical protein TNCV_735651 [Trichonephila clavipes]